MMKKLPDGSIDIQNYFEYIIKKYKSLTVKQLVQIYIHIIQSKILFKIKSGYFLEPLTPKTMKSLSNTEQKWGKNDENVPNLENIAVGISSL